MVTQSPEVAHTVPGRSLTDPDWLAARITEMGRSWGTTEPRVAGTLWWCMVASALVEQLARAYADGTPPPEPVLERLDCEVRPDGGVERVHMMPPVGETVAADYAGAHRGVAADPSRGAAADPSSRGTDADPSSGGTDAAEPLEADVRQHGTEADHPSATAPHLSAHALRQTLAAVITPVAAVSGAGIPSLWAIVADAIGNRALDAGAPDAGTRLAEDVGGKLPVPRFVEVGGRTFVRRISCCLVFEVPSCEMCTSCPKRPAADRRTLLANLAAET